jgi:hypothetical protein
MNPVARKAMAAIGWRTIAEAIASRVLFLVVYLLTDRLLPAALVAVGGVLAFTAVRLRTERPKWWQAAIPLVVMGLSAALAKGTGHAVDFYLPEIVPDLVLGPVFLLSLIVRRPVVGLILRDQRPDLSRRCTVVLLVKFVVAATVMLTLYLADHVVALAIAGTVLTTPALALCGYLCWRIIR